MASKPNRWAEDLKDISQHREGWLKSIKKGMASKIKKEPKESERQKEIRLRNTQSMKHGEKITKDKSIKAKWFKQGPNDYAGFHNKPSTRNK